MITSLIKRGTIEGGKSSNHVQGSWCFGKQANLCNSVCLSIFMNILHLDKLTWEEIAVAEYCRCYPCWMDLILHSVNDFQIIWANDNPITPQGFSKRNPSFSAIASTDRTSSTVSILELFAAMNFPLLSLTTTPVVPLRLSSSKEASTLTLTKISLRRGVVLKPTSSLPWEFWSTSQIFLGTELAHLYNVVFGPTTSAS